MIFLSRIHNKILLFVAIVVNIKGIRVILERRNTKQKQKIGYYRESFKYSIFVKNAEASKKLQRRYISF